MNINNLKEIVENAPEGATHIETLASTRTYYLKRSIKCGVYGYQLWSADHECFIGSGGASGNIRSLEDIRTIIELYEVASLVYLTRNNGELDEKIAKTLERFK